MGSQVSLSTKKYKCIIYSIWAKSRQDLSDTLFILLSFICLQTVQPPFWTQDYLILKQAVKWLAFVLRGSLISITADIYCKNHSKSNKLFLWMLLHNKQNNSAHCAHVTIALWNSQSCQLYIMQNHSPTAHVFLLHCEPQSHQLYCVLEVVQRVIQRFTLQWCYSLIKCSCCPGPRGFIFTVILRGINDCRVHQGWQHMRN
jgi:hypothetical protein